MSNHDLDRLPHRVIIDDGYRLWVSDDRCTLFRVWADGTAELATRDVPAGSWGPPVKLTEEA